MKPKESVDVGEQDLFHSRLDQILEMGHAKVVLVNTNDWEFLTSHCGENYALGPHPSRRRISRSQHPCVNKFRTFTLSQKWRVTPAIKRERKRRSAVEPVIGHIKHDNGMSRNFLAHKQGDAINPILAAAGYNFRLILKCITLLWLQIWWAPVSKKSPEFA